MSALLLAVTLHAASALTAQELRGRRIYRTGSSDSGTPIVALVSADADPVPATVLPCASCHGRDATGREEGGVRPSNLRWSALTRPYADDSPGARPHPPYTPETLKRAITMGIDSAKNPLRPPMPRYQLSMRDADDLVAYLRRIEDDRDPGLTDDAMRIGVVLPDEGRDTVRRELTALFAQSPTIFGRRLDIRYEDRVSVDDFVAIAANVDGDPGLPVIAASATGDANRDVFTVSAGIEEQSVALVNALPPGTPVRIVHDTATAALASAVATRLGNRVTKTAPAALILGTPEASPRGAKTLLVPAPYVTPAILATKPPTQLLVSIPLPRTAIVAAAELLIRAIERAGRDADRDTLIETLESFRNEPTVATPPVTWSAASHTGTAACAIVPAPGR